MATVMMSLTAEAKTQDVGGRVIDQNGEPLGFVSIALLSLLHRFDDAKICESCDFATICDEW